MADWVPDVLGDDFEQVTLPLGQDPEGEIVATLVRLRPGFALYPRSFSDVDVLYVHGWSDYFFQARLARFWTDRGARFYALDLRKYGRSLRPGQTPGYISDLTQYDDDIAAALAAMEHPIDGSSSRRLVLVGHSTGGLTLSLWGDRHPGVVAGVILNSPWLEFQLSAFSRQAVAPLVELQSRIRPLNTMPQVDLGFYARAQAAVADPADLTPNPAWRPEHAMAVHTGWLNAILHGHGRVAAKLAIDAPVCVLLSARSAVPTRWSEALTEADTVLTVDEIARAALNLGSSVTIERIDGALHDVFLSRKQARDEAYARMERWALGYLAR